MKTSIARIEEILLPTTIKLIILSLIVAILFNVFPWSGWALTIRPDFVAIVLLHWSAREPHKINFSSAWIFGLFMDVSEGSLLGQHALAYVVLVYLAKLLSRRLQMFELRFQVLHLLPLLFLYQLLILIIGLAGGGKFSGWSFFAPVLTGAAIWPIVYILLELPRQPKLDPNEP